MIYLPPLRKSTEWLLRLTVLGFACGAMCSQPLAAQDVETAVEFGGSTVGAATIQLPAFGSDSSNCELAPTPEPYVVQPLAVDSTDVYEIRIVEAIDLSGTGNTDDTILTLYADSLSTSDPCDGFITIGNVVEGEGLDAELTAGVQYALVVSGFLGSEGEYRLSIVGPPGRSIWLGRLGTGTEGPATASNPLAGPSRISAVYPNPFDVQAEFSVEVAESQDIRIDVFDLLGRRVDVLFDGHQPAGVASRVRVDGSSWSPGIYFVHVAGETFSDSRAVTIAR